MTYRSIDTEIWNDPYFENLSKDAKLLFLYLWTNKICNQAGLYEISERRINFESGIDSKIFLQELIPKVEYIDHKYIWVKNFFQRQCASIKFAIAAFKSIQKFPDDIKLTFIGYNITHIKKYNDYKKLLIRFGFDPTIPYDIGYRYPIGTPPLSGTGTVTDTEKNKECEKPPDKSGKLNIKKIDNQLNTICDMLYDQKLFSKAHVFRNTMLKAKKNKQAILYTLTQYYLIARKKPITGDPFAYCIKIIQKENGNFNEADHVEMTNGLKAEMDKFLKNLDTKKDSKK